MSKRRWWIVAVIVVVFAAGITIGVAAFGSSSSPEAVTLEPATSIGTHPFTGSVTARVVALSAHAQAVTTAQRTALSTNPATDTLVATGTAPGLYGGTGDPHVCDTAKLVAFLRQNPDKAAAWAGVLGITPNRIAGYVATLTPVLLTNDTLVTNHGFENGNATTLQSVLQAGTAVMVDATGTPRVKCNCGNPLTPPEVVTAARLQGTGWPGYAPTQVTVVNAGPVTKIFTLVNVTTGGTYAQPVGGRSAPGSWVIAETNGDGSSPDASTHFVKTTDAKTFADAGSIPGYGVVALAYGNGTWLAATTPGQRSTDTGSRIFESTDLRTWTQVAKLADYVDGIAYGNGRWAAIGFHVINSLTGEGAAHYQTVAYTGTEPTHWTEASLDASPEGFHQGIAYGPGGFIATVPADLSQTDFKLTIATFASADGTHWERNGGTVTTNAATAIARGPAKWLVTTYNSDGPSGVYTSRDAINWSAARTSGLDNASLNALANGNHTWLAAGQAPAVGGVAPFSLYTSPNGTAWTRRSGANGTVTAIAFGGSVSEGGAAPTNASTPTAPTVTTPVTTTNTPTTQTPTTATPTTSAPQGGQVVASTPCTFQSDIPGSTSTLGPGPTSVTLPAGVTLPTGATVYASTADRFFIAPVGFRCKATLEEDDWEIVTITNPTNPKRFVVFNGGGSLEPITRGCSYFPAQRATNPPGGPCKAAPASVSSAALPTGSTDIQAAAVAVPRDVAAPGLPGEASDTPTTPPANDVPMYAIFVAHWGPEGGTGPLDGTADELQCALVPSKSAMCSASLQLMLEHSQVPVKPPAQSALQQFMAAHS